MSHLTYLLICSLESIHREEVTWFELQFATYNLLIYTGVTVNLDFIDSSLLTFVDADFEVNRVSLLTYFIRRYIVEHVTFVVVQVSYREVIGIQTLADIPLDIPEEKTIQEELDVIYSAERKLDNLFAGTGLKEEKFKSLTDTPVAEEKEYTQYDFELEAFPTKYLKQTICTGQYISFEGNLVIIGDCHEGSEISAAGDITIWGELSGSVHAGKNGNEKCRIRALKMNASQLRIANCYVKRPASLNDAQNVEAVPEEAMISKGEIAVYRIYK